MIGYLEKRGSFAILLTALMALEIFIISSIPGSDFSTGTIDFSSLYHLLIFFLFNFFLILSVVGSKKLEIKYVVLALVISIIYAVLDEVHQFFVPRRIPSMADVLIDIIGIFLSTITYFHYKGKNNKMKVMEKYK